jgi:RHS repeat-associated protein
LKNSTGTTANNYRYTGQQFDQLTGLYSLRARYYNPSEGRFLNRDKYQINILDPLELNRYGYVANNPTNFTDPSGNYSLGEYVLGYSIFTGAVAVATVAGFFASQWLNALIYNMIVAFSVRGGQRQCQSSTAGQPYICTHTITGKQANDIGTLFQVYGVALQILSAIAFTFGGFLLAGGLIITALVLGPLVFGAGAAVYWDGVRIYNTGSELKNVNEKAKVILYEVNSSFIGYEVIG